MNDQVDLCPGCNTIKHLDPNGLCGRCNVANMFNTGSTDSDLNTSTPADNAMAGELDSFKYFLRYLQAMPDVDKYALAPEQVDAIAVKVIILLENERARLLEDLEIEHTKELEACIASTRQDLLESLRRELPEKPIYPEVMEYVAMVKNAGEHGKYDDMYDNGYNAAIDTVNQLLTKYVQRGENGE